MNCYNAHFKDENMEAERGQETCLNGTIRKGQSWKSKQDGQSPWPVHQSWRRFEDDGTRAQRVHISGLYTSYFYLGNTPLHILIVHLNC